MKTEDLERFQVMLEHMRAETLDFVQLNYSLDERQAEQRLLPLAAERGIGMG